MSSHTDIIVFSTSGQPSLAIEVKNKLGTTAEWAAKMRRNLAVHGTLPEAEYFLLALPDRFYLWKGATEDPRDLPPTYEIDAGQVLAAYYERDGLSLDKVSGRAFELLVASWLQDLVQRPDLPSGLSQGEAWIAGSGLLDAIKGGRIQYEVEV